MIVGDYDLRGADIEMRFAKFSRDPLSDDEVWALSMAKLVLPASSIGDKLFLTRVSDCRGYRAEIADWAAMVAGTVAGARLKRPGGIRRRVYCEGYQSGWGRHAALDGVALAMFGECPPLTVQADRFGVDHKTYRKIRDFVGGVAVDAIAEYRFALEWAMGWRRDRVFDARAAELKVRIPEPRETLSVAPSVVCPKTAEAA